MKRHLGHHSIYETDDGILWTGDENYQPVDVRTIYGFGVEGDMICCWRLDNFIDLAVSPAGFGHTETEALRDLWENEEK